MQRIDTLKNMYRVAALTLAVQGAACATSTQKPGDETSASQKQAIKILNGSSLNGSSLNGNSLNGLGTNGLNLNGLSLNGLSTNGNTLNGLQINGIEVAGGQLVGTLSGTDAPLSGKDFEGALLQGALSDGTTLPLKIEAVNATNDPELLSYTVRYWNGTSWDSLCGEADGAPVQALVLRGRWDLSSGTPTGGDYIDGPGQLTFACHGAALSKCAMLGYKPWKTVTECNGTNCHEVPVRALHQACTRMLRADYCGDGMPHTRDGVPVDIWDSFKIQVPVDANGAWLPDAEWSPEGAVCAEHLRTVPGKTTKYINEHCPERWEASFSCFSGNSTFFPEHGKATPLSERSLIRNEFSRPDTHH
jgi:hypothetical protein